MGAENYKQLMQTVFAELAQGRPARLFEIMADDCRWTVIGTTPWSGHHAGRQAIDDFVEMVDRRFTGRITSTADRFIAEGEYVVVQFHGHATTTEGRPYNNTYCWVCRLIDGKLRQITEYADTQLAMTTLFSS
ncbi:nuclear transport factor 2 family protein [Nocardia sp. CDC159]|uniref:Nuclear transport factor 2 family protein n=1 Tax=Nocardia pulmonis TaxID=2951408 RepID=A0A9X2E845_9NOCA|nr:MULTISPECIES: nuclear transport factor 2 family protein [Nocardia]MCM6775356.1 nuclear transport factor 2 family protein [Nocardia pulmonis]MCM6787910.1 nuclear transport factor 2 family protein [Nocardia sp. CDC159]